MNACVSRIMNKPIFILGSPRSGTTFLAGLLKDAGYGEPFESHFITKYYKKLADYGDINVYKNFLSLLEDILNERAVKQEKSDFDHEKFFKELGAHFTYSQLVDKICLKVFQQEGFNSWCDKTPNYLGDIDILYELFPDSKYIYLVRDGRDVTLSLLEKDWGPNNIYYCARYWVTLNQGSVHLDCLEVTNNLYQLRYEDLLDNVEKYVKEIYSFLGWKCDKAELLELAKTVKSGNYNKWKKHMTSRQINIFDRVAADILKQFDYEISTEERPISFIWRILYFSHNVIFRIRHLFIINVIDGVKIRFFGKEPFAE